MTPKKSWKEFVSIILWLRGSETPAPQTPPSPPNLVVGRWVETGLALHLPLPLPLITHHQFLLNELNEKPKDPVALDRRPGQLLLLFYGQRKLVSSFTEISAALSRLTRATSLPHPKCVINAPPPFPLLPQ